MLKKIFTTTGFVLFFIILGFSFPLIAAQDTQKANPVEEFKAKRKLFYKERNALINQYNELMQIIEASKLKASKNSQVQKRSKSITEEPLISVIIIVGISYLIYLLVSHRRDQSVIKKGQKCLFFFLVSISPLLLEIAYGQNNISNEADRYTFQEKITEADKILKADDINKAIMKLERKMQLTINIPNIAFQRPLAGAKMEVRVDSSEYYYTLAALYHLKDNISQIEYYLEKLSKRLLTDIKPRGRRITILTNIIDYYLSKGKREEALAWGKLLIKHSNDFNKVSSGLSYCLKNHLTGPALRALDKILEMKMTKEQRNKAFNLGFALTRQAIQENTIEFAAYAAEKCQILANSLDHLMKLANFCNSHHLSNTAQNIIDIGVKRYPKPNQLAVIAEVLYKWGDDKKALDIIDMAIKRAKSTDDLMNLIWFCINKGHVERAITGAQTLLQYFPGASTNEVPCPELICSSSELPVQGKIKMLTLIGALYLKKGNSTLAESYFRKVVEMDIERFIVEGGFNVNMNLNDMFYLIQTYLSMKNLDMIKNLEPIYAFLEAEYLRQLEDTVQVLKQKIENLSAKEKMSLAISTGISGKMAPIAFWSWVLFVASLPWLLDFLYMTCKNRGGKLPKLTQGQEE